MLSFVVIADWPIISGIKYRCDMCNYAVVSLFRLREHKGVLCLQNEKLIYFERDKLVKLNFKFHIFL